MLSQVDSARIELNYRTPRWCKRTVCCGVKPHTSDLELELTVPSTFRSVNMVISQLKAMASPSQLGFPVTCSPFWTFHLSTSCLLHSHPMDTAHLQALPFLDLEITRKRTTRSPRPKLSFDPAWTSSCSRHWAFCPLHWGPYLVLCSPCPHQARTVPAPSGMSGPGLLSVYTGELCSYTMVCVHICEPVNVSKKILLSKFFLLFPGSWKMSFQRR